MARVPAQRYPSMEALRADLSAWLEGRVVAAYEHGWWARLRKWARRNRALAFLAAGALVALPAIAVLVGYGLEQRDQARRTRPLRHRDALEQAKSAAAQLYPAWPENIAPLRAWLQTHAEPLRAAAGEVQNLLRALREDQARADVLTGFLVDVYVRLHDDLSRFLADNGLVGDVRQRLAWAESTQRLSVDTHRARWDEARAAIARADGHTASRLYGAVPIDLRPQLDLVPIGMNPRTGLWEFHHLPSAGDTPAAAVHDSNGHIVVEPHTGIVFVLVPGGSFVMGADLDPASPHFDELAEANEEPAHAVTLAPFFIARHELTMAQWYRLNADRRPRGATAAARPISLIPWADADRALGRHRLCLPTEAQWEYAARAGTTTRFWTGNDLATLAGAANLADQTARRLGNWWPGLEESFADGVATAAAVDSMRANPFGLHHVHGNVAEWVRDDFNGYRAAPRAGDGLRGASANWLKVFRGGNFALPARRVRASFRGTWFGSSGPSAIGIRAARELEAAPAAAPVHAGTLVRWASNGHHYALIETPLSWDDARADAESRTHDGVRGHLVTITSEAENDFVTTNLATGNAWLGAFQDASRADYAEPAGGWVWVTGEPVTFQAWGHLNEDEPSNVYLGGLTAEDQDPPTGSSEEVAQYWRLQPTVWNDVPRHANVRLPYVIEFDTPASSRKQ
jgi:formylglycine-generating enzyme required for sulfatase activity